MRKSWLSLTVVAGCSLLISAPAFAQDGLNTVDASESRKSWLMKSKLPGMSDASRRNTPDTQRQQLKIQDSGDKKFEIKGGVVRRYWAEQDSHLASALGKLETDYQLGISLFSGPGEFEFAFAGGMSGGDYQYFQNTVDLNKLIVWNYAFVFIGDVPVKLNYTENLKLWNFQLRYWHNLGDRKPTSFQIGPGAHFYVLEKHTKVQVQYEDWGPEFLILNPAYQNSESHSTTLIPGISLGARGRLDIASNFGNEKRYLGSILASGEYVLAKPSGISVGGYPLTKLNNFNLTLQYAYAFE